MRRTYWILFLAGGVMVGAIAALLHYGDHWLSDESGAASAAGFNLDPLPLTILSRNLAQPLPRLGLQIIVVLALARGCAALARRIGQPAVLGEMTAGVLLGPSLLRIYLPDVFTMLFPADSLPALQLLSQIAVILFIFAVGLEFSWERVPQQARTAIAVSNISILLPFLLGVIAAMLLYGDYAPAGVPFRAFGLFMGIAMSITAFPVLARILEERHLMRTPIGTTALACAAFDDVTAWTLLAFVVAVVTSRGALATLALTLGCAGTFVGMMFFIVRPALRRWLASHSSSYALSTEPIGLVIGVLLASALATEIIGIHALFGAFVAGAVMPDAGQFRERLRDRLESLSSALLLPLFFAFTGLRMQIGLLNDASGWLVFGGLVALATAGELGGSTATARLMGMDLKNALVLGALLNTRGLMELIALNIGYDLGVISPEIFAPLVLMALVTTALTGPLIDLAYARLAASENTVQACGCDPVA